MTEVGNALEKIWKIEMDIERYSNSVLAITDEATQPNGITDSPSVNNSDMGDQLARQ